MPTEILMPKLGLTMKEGTVVSWAKEEGEDVEEKEPLLDIETEKLSYSVESPRKGVLLKKLAGVGDKYPVSAVLGYVGNTGDIIPAPPPGQFVSDNAGAAGPSIIPATAEMRDNTRSAGAYSLADTAQKRGFISPVARKLAADMGIDHTLIRGTGPNGRVVKADVLSFSDSQAAAKRQSSDKQNTIIPYSGLRRAVGEAMMNAWSTIPMVTHQVSAPADALLDYRKLLNCDITDSTLRITVGEILLKLTAIALALTPIMNSSLTDEGIVLFKQVNMGMATALEGGLIVPVIQDADKKGLLTISRESKDLASKARSGALTPDDVYGATFTISNLGSFGSVYFFTPIINPPQAAILGVGHVAESAVPADEGFPSVNEGLPPDREKRKSLFKTRWTIGLSLTYDHRIIDGAAAAGFVKTLMQLMENPARALLN